MHELKLAREIFDLVDAALQEHAMKSLKIVHCKIGELQPLIEEQLQSCYQILIENTRLAGSCLHIERVPAQARCRKCGREFDLDELHLFCPHCQSTQLVILSGDELLISDLETETCQ